MKSFSRPRLGDLVILVWAACALSACIGGDGAAVPSRLGTLELLAGHAGAAGSADATGLAARFRSPSAVATDTNGNVYVVDSGNGTLRKITLAGVVTTLAGIAGATGSTDATGGAASFNGPTGVATDPTGNVYVADYGNHTIRRVTPAGVVTTFAGKAGTPGSADGAGESARFYFPWGVATDSAGNVYVADYGNCTIRRITPAGFVTTLAGVAGVTGSADGTGSAASFWWPVGIVADSEGTVYVADYGTAIIRKVLPDGTVTTLAGGGLRGSGGLDGLGTAASFYGPTGLALDHAGVLYVADWTDNAIRRIAPNGMVTHLAGGSVQVFGSVDGTGGSARFWGPEGVAIDNSGNVIVADEFNDEIRRITPGGVVTTVAGLARLVGNADGAGPAASFDSPQGLAADRSGNLFVADTANGAIRKVTPGGVVTTLATGSGITNGATGLGSTPTGVAIDSSGNVYVADSRFNTIARISPTGVATSFAGFPGPCSLFCDHLLGGSNDGTGAAAGFLSPAGMAVDLADNIYVADSGNNTIRKITRDGVVTTLAGMAGTTGTADGAGALARFHSPSGIATDNLGNLYVADTGNSTIRRVTPNGVVTTIAGSPGMPGISDGEGAMARFLLPWGVATDSEGNVYVADSGNNTIRRISRTGFVTTIVGQPGVASFSPGSLPGLLEGPIGLALVGTNLYLTTSNAVAVVALPRK
jgi:sugar lactone lactonase YvrE